MLNLLGLARSIAGDLPGAFEAFSRERDEHAATGAEAQLAASEGNLAEIALRMGDLATAARHQAASLSLALVLGQPVMLAYSFIVAARIAASRAEWATAASLQTKAKAVLDSTGSRLYADDLRASDELSAEIIDNLTEAELSDAVRAGLSLDVPEVTALATAVLAGSRP
jgi:hypothetical protein